MARTKTITQNDTQHVEHHDATDVQKNIIDVIITIIIRANRYQIPASQNRQVSTLE